MSDELKRWQAEIWTGPKTDEPVLVYGDSMSTLCQAAAEWLRENRPEIFSNVSPDDKLSRRTEYFYSDGTLEPDPSQFYSGHSHILKDGWYCLDRARPYFEPVRLDNLEQAIDDFIRRLVPEKGPDYLPAVPWASGNVPLHFIRTVRQVSNESEANDMMQRGWRIIALDYSGDTDEQGSLIYRHTVFVLGHLEENAL